MFRIAYLVRAVRTLDSRCFPSLSQAGHALRAIKRLGFTAWIETDAGIFVPVKGAMRKPAHR